MQNTINQVILKKQIKVSLIVPVYNVEAYLEECLQSLVNQTLQQIEIIVVNDGSPDNSQGIIDRFTEAYPAKVRSFRKENGGLSPEISVFSALRENISGLWTAMIP